MKNYTHSEAILIVISDRNFEDEQFRGAVFEGDEQIEERKELAHYECPSSSEAALQNCSSPEFRIFPLCATKNWLFQNQNLTWKEIFWRVCLKLTQLADSNDNFIALVEAQAIANVHRFCLWFCTINRWASRLHSTLVAQARDHNKTKTICPFIILTSNRFLF